MQTLEVQGFLSNREVLDILLEEREDQQRAIDAISAAQRTRERDTESKGKKPAPWDRARELARLVLPDNVHAVQTNIIQYLTDPGLVTSQQSTSSVVALTRSLSSFERSLTRSEKLQIVNQLPNALPELYIIVDKLQERVDEDRQTELLELIKTHLSEMPVAENTETQTDLSSAPDIGEATKHEEADMAEVEEDIWEENQEMDMSDQEEDMLVGATSKYDTQMGPEQDVELDEGDGADIS